MVRLLSSTHRSKRTGRVECTLRLFCLFWEGKIHLLCGEDVGGGGAQVQVSLESGQMVQTGCLWQSRSQIWGGKASSGTIKGNPAEHTKGG